jgi:Mycothiol maleylpyruvate isomerase N-terminal domain
MAPPAHADRSPVTSGDVDLAVQLAVATLAAAPDAAAWAAPAGALDWTCWETAEHLSDDLFSYAAQIGPRTPPLTDPVPFAWTRARPGAPANAIRADPAAGPAGLLQVLEACGALLAAMVATTPAQVRAHHSYGISDPEGFAAMGVVETLVHTHDLALGLGLSWTPPADLCSRALARLFPDALGAAEPWRTLLWANCRTGRAAPSGAGGQRPCRSPDAPASGPVASGAIPRNASRISWSMAACQIHDTFGTTSSYASALEQNLLAHPSRAHGADEQAWGDGRG